MCLLSHDFLIFPVPSPSLPVVKVQQYLVTKPQKTASAEPPMMHPHVLEKVLMPLVCPNALQHARQFMATFQRNSLFGWDCTTISSQVYHFHQVPTTFLFSRKFSDLFVQCSRLSITFLVKYVIVCMVQPRRLMLLTLTLDVIRGFV